MLRGAARAAVNPDSGTTFHLFVPEIESNSGSRLGGLPFLRLPEQCSSTGDSSVCEPVRYERVRPITAVLVEEPGDRGMQHTRNSRSRLLPFLRGRCHSVVGECIFAHSRSLPFSALLRFAQAQNFPAGRPNDR